ncbi:hypothetical protein GCM10009727_54850 [Actinomadura napierensis]|uniref:Uncharacterized protein n=1 Tax=Actinomadura napierensis TaxID=267854 RepID=A0ABN2ZZ85_9ACTN
MAPFASCPSDPLHADAAAAISAPMATRAKTRMGDLPVLIGQACHDQDNHPHTTPDHIRPVRRRPIANAYSLCQVLMAASSAPL